MQNASPNRTTSRAEERETAILQAAMRLFGEDGFYAVSTRRIAAAAGVSEGTLFNYFASKNDLLRAILHAIYVELTTNATAILKREYDSRQRLQELAMNHLQVMTRNNALFLRMVQVYMNVDMGGYHRIRDSVLHQLNLGYAWVFDVTVKEAMARGEVRSDINLSALRDLYFGGLEYLARSLFLHDSFDEFEERVSSIVQPLWESMLATTATPAHDLHSTADRLEAVAARLESLSKQRDP